MIAERIPGDSDPGIDVLYRGIGGENVGHACKRSKRRVDDGVEWMHVGGGIGHEFISDADVQRQFGKRLPLIVDIYVEFPFAKVAIGVREPRLRSLEEARGALQETGQAGKSIEAAPPPLLLEVALDAVEGCAKSEAVRSVRPDDVVRQREFVLHFQKRGEDAGPDRTTGR